jgi:glycerol-1-phosphate dehydrogenase [NAD(P)+]
MHKYDIPESVIFFDKTIDLSTRLIQILNTYGHKDPLFICGANSYRELGEKVFHQCKSVLNDSEIIIAPEINKELIANDLAQEYLKSQSPIVGIGGGRILDFAKYISFKTDRPFISIPSNAAHDGIFSPISVIAGFSLGSKMPDYLMISLNTLEKAPLISIQAGIGDLIANFTAINDCYISEAFKDKDRKAEIGDCEHSHEVLNQEAINLAYQGSIELIDLIYATQANDEIVTKFTESRLDLLRSSSFLRQFIKSLVLSGMAMYYANNSSPCSGSEHMISHAIDAIYGHGVKAAHGVQVAVASYFIYPQQLEILKKINQTPERIINFEELFTLLKLPKSFQEIGVSSKELDYVLKLAPKTRANKFSILNLKDDRLKISN